MRLFLLPISTRQSLLFCKRLKIRPDPAAKPSITDRLTTKATTTWLDWEKKESGWQKTVTDYGNKLFQRLPFQEYGLKSVPPLTAAIRDQWQKRKGRRKELEAGSAGQIVERPVTDLESVKVEYPAGIIEEKKAWDVVQRLGSDETQNFHGKWLAGCLVGMPISAPFALVPIVPNLPFFYLCFRAWSHWRARSGSQHLEYLLKEKVISLEPSAKLRMAYAEAALDMTAKRIEADTKDFPPSLNGGKQEVENKSAQQPPGDSEEMLLPKSSGKLIAEWLEVPELHAEIDRAVWQVERSIRKRQLSEAPTK